MNRNQLNSTLSNSNLSLYDRAALLDAYRLAGGAKENISKLSSQSTKFRYLATLSIFGCVPILKYIISFY